MKIARTGALMSRMLMLAALIALPCLARAQDNLPAPSDTAKLYANAKAEGGTIIWYLNQPIAPMRLVANDFEKQYPGLHVELYRGIGAQLMQKYVREEDSKQYIADLIQISDPIMMKELADQNYLAHWAVPTLDRIPASFKIGDQAVTIIVTDMAILYNTNKLTPDEVKLLQASWYNVTDPRFKGRFAVVNAPCGICYAGLSFFLDPKYQKEYGNDFLIKVAKQDPATYADSVVAIDRVVAGESDFLFFFSEGTGVTEMKAGAPMRWIEPSPRPSYANVLQGVSAHAPHPNGARLFQNWINSDAGAQSLQQSYGVRTVLAGVADNRDVAKQPWSPHPQDYTVSIDRWSKEYTKDQQLWFADLKQYDQH